MYLKINHIKQIPNCNSNNPTQQNDITSLFDNIFLKCQWANLSYERHRVEIYMKRNPTICYLEKTHLKFQGRYRFRVKDRKAVMQGTGKQNRKRLGQPYLYQTKYHSTSRK